MAVQLQTLRSRARKRADMENSEFVTDSELDDYINTSYKELYDILVSKFEQWYVSDPTSLTLTTSDAGKKALASDFYKLEGVDQQIGGKWREVHQFNFNERNRSGSLDRWTTVEYRVVGTDLRFSPVDQAVGTFRYWYTPIATEMSNDTDTMDGVNGWEEYVVIDAARKMLLKEESDISGLLQEKQALLNRIEIMAQNRDVANAQQVEDVYADDSELFWW